MTLDKIVSGLFMAAWFTGNGALLFGLLAVLGLDGYTIGTRIMLVLVILFLCSVGNLLAITFLYPD